MTKYQRWIQIGSEIIGNNSFVTVPNETPDSEMATPPTTIPAETSNFKIFETVEIWRVKAMAIIANKDCVVTSSASESFTLKANSALIYVDGDPEGMRFFTQNFTWLSFTPVDQEETIVQFAHKDYAGDD